MFSIFIISIMHQFIGRYIWKASIKFLTQSFSPLLMKLETLSFLILFSYLMNGPYGKALDCEHYSINE